MSLRRRFKSEHPNAEFLDLQPGDWQHILYRNAWLEPSEKVVTLEKPGEGNMNFVVRVRTDSRSIILKQARPWVEKYPQIEAPVERVFVESKFYEILSHDRFFDAFVPHLIGYDANNLLLAMEDLGQGTDFTFLYSKTSSLQQHDKESLIEFISHLHNFSPANRKFPDNTALKSLNHTHIFEYPYMVNNGFDLDTIQNGLQALAMKYKNNETLKQRIKPLGDLYLARGPVLLHGDYYPGSWLKTNAGVKIIDPEFSHYGYAEFDMGVFTAHLMMAHVRDAEIRSMFEAYVIPRGFDKKLLTQFCGVEIIRRIIGLAQLPLDMTLQEKSLILDRAEQMILEPEQLPGYLGA